MAGKQFQPLAEADLLPDLIRLAVTLVTRHEDEVIAIPEFVGPYGIADLVALTIRQDALRQRLAAGVAPLIYEPDAAIVAALTPSTSRLPDAVADRLGWPAESVERRVPKLVRGGAVVRTSRGGLTRHPALAPVGRVHALEAKVRDWRRGCNQVRRYALWADTATLVLGHVPTMDLALREEIERCGVGLAINDRWLCRPRREHHGPARRLLASEFAVAALAESAVQPGAPPLPSPPALLAGVEIEACG